MTDETTPSVAPAVVEAPAEATPAPVPPNPIEPERAGWATPQHVLDAIAGKTPATVKVGDLELVATDEENVLMDPQTGELYTSAGQRLGRMRKL